MRRLALSACVFLIPLASVTSAEDPPRDPLVVFKPDAFRTLVNPACSHCRDEAKRRAGELKPSDRVLAWTRGYSEGGAIPFRFFLNPYRVISDSYGVFVSDPEAGYARGFAPSYEFRFHGWRNGVMVMKHNDGTLYSCLTGVAFAGPKKGARLTPIPTVVADWGWWLDKYPGAVAYQMLEKYQPVDLPPEPNGDSVFSRAKPDPRLNPEDNVLGVWTGKSARAYPIAALEKSGFLTETVDDATVVILWEPITRTASAYRPVASQPRKFKGPAPDATGVSPADAGEPVPQGAPIVPPRKVALALASAGDPGRFRDAETGSYWDVAGRCVAGELKGFTLEWVDSVQVKWFAWSAECPGGSIFDAKQTPDSQASADAAKQVKMIAGAAELLRLLPKPLATIQAVDARARTVTLLADGDKEPKTWTLEPDAEVKVRGWWGRLDQFNPGDRVWAWMKLDRKKTPISVVMLADALSEWDMHGRHVAKEGAKPTFSEDEIRKAREDQRAWLRDRWERRGLPGTLTFLHVFSGELELTLDHEAMRWGRSLRPGDAVELESAPPIKGVVRTVVPWRERTVVRLVVGELESSELKIGERLRLKMPVPSPSVEQSPYPSDIDRERSPAERVEWLLASMYCVCGVGADTCTGQFYTLASCNPNGCGMPNARRKELRGMIDQGFSDRRILDDLLKSEGPQVLGPHLRP